MKVYYLAGKERVELRDEPLPTLGPAEVLVKTLVSAVSVGTEVWRYSNYGHYGGEGGQCGYNSVGRVIDLGAQVVNLKAGDLVFAPHPHSEYFAVVEDRAVKLPPGVDLEAAAFCYLPTLGLHGLREAGYQPGDNVLVVGLGVVGALAAMVAQLVGGRVAALEIHPARRAWGQRLGFGPVLDARGSEVSSVLSEHFQGLGPDIVLETSQAWEGLIDGIRLARQGSRISIVGIYRSDPAPEVARDLLRLTFMNRDHFHNQWLKLIGCSNDPRDEYPAGVVRWTIQRNIKYIASMIASGELNTSQIITHRFRWDELGEVYRRLSAGEREMVGVVLHWD